MKVLALGAHPDDLELFAFGSLMAWQKMGFEVALAIATDGAGGGTMDPTLLRPLRRAEAIAGVAPLGVVPHFLNFPDGQLMADRALTEELHALIAVEKPDLLVTHAPNCYHADHRALSAGVSQAAGFGVPVLYMDTLNGTGFAPNIYVDVTAQFEAKETAIRAHQSQDPERFVTIANRQAAFRAGECNGRPQDRAEAFRFEPRAPFGDIRALLPPAPRLRAVIDRASVNGTPT